MRNYLLGILTMFLLGFTFQLIWYVGLNKDNDNLADFGYKAGEIIRGNGIILPLTNRCSDDKRGNDPDSVTEAQYFGCNGLQIAANKLIWGQK